MTHDERLSPIDKRLTDEMTQIEKLIEEENYEEAMIKTDAQINYIEGTLEHESNPPSIIGLVAVIRDRKLLKRIIEINKLINEKHAEFEIRLDELEGKIKKIEGDSTLR